jgi:hypothetical protein
MIQVYRIPVPKERLRAMPRDERVLLLLLGYAANQLSMLQKLLNFATNRTPDAEVEQHATGTQTQMLVRLMVGALNEAWELVSTRFIQNPLAKDYLRMLDRDGQQAFDAIKRQFGGSNLLNAVRNNYAFHYPRSDEAEEAFEAAFDDRELDGYWNLYFSQHGFNSLFFLSDLIFVHGIGKKAGGTDLEETQRKLMGEVSAASANLIEFAKAFVAAAWLKHFGEEMVAKDIVTVSDAPNVDDVWLPFFVEVPPGEQQGGRDA